MGGEADMKLVAIKLTLETSKAWLLEAAPMPQTP